MRSSITQIINGIRYNTETATLIASDEYWDGSNHERGGTNCHLYRSKKGRYFLGHSTQWQGGHQFIETISEIDAKKTYEKLKEQNHNYEDAFPGSVVPDA